MPIAICTDSGAPPHATPPPLPSPRISSQETPIPTKRVCIIGAGNWGSVAAIIIAENVKKFDYYHDTVSMWVFEEIIDGKKLTDIINEQHVNVKYLPNNKLPDTIVAYPQLIDAARDCNVLVFVLPHQFLVRACKTLNGYIPPDTIAISLIKGIDFNDNGVILMSDIIKKELSIDVSVLSGANIADEIAAGKFCESTIGYQNPENAVVFFELFNNQNFRISLVEEVEAVQVFGALKNVIALGAGFSDALDMGNNTKAALIRIGLLEMHRFATKYFAPIHDATMVESCGIADLITTCMGGRNRRVSEAFGRAGGKRSWEELEAEMLNGQKLQGTSTVLEVMKILKRDNCVQDFPFIKLIYNIAYEGADVQSIVHFPNEHAADALS